MGNSKYFTEELKRRGVTIDVRAPQQHARFIERRGAILRHAMHTTEEQMQREGLPCTFDSLLAHSIFAGNSLTHVGGVTPYNVVFGRQPSMLPPLEVPDGGEADGGHAADPAEAQPSRQQWRVREIALQRMIEATSIARVNRALRTRTSASAEGQFNVGDVVEIHRPSDTQDVSGWAGPGTVLSVDPAHGKVTVKYRRADMICRIQDVRTFIGAVFDPFGTFMTRAGLAWDIVQDHLEHLHVGTGARTFGYWQDPAGIHATDWSKQYPQLTSALRHVAHSCMQLSNVSAVRLSRGQRKLGSWTGCTHSLIIWWWPRDHTNYHQCHHDAVRCDLAKLIGTDWQSARVMQFILSDDALLMADESHELFSERGAHGADAPDGDDEVTEGGSPSALSVIPEEAESEFSAHADQVYLAAWQEVSNGEDLTGELHELAPDESQQLIFAAVEHAAAG